MLTAAVPAGTRAQAVAPQSSSVLCLRPRPLASGCAHYVFFDAVGAVGIIRGSHPLGLGRTTDDLPSYGGGLIGAMSNVNGANAVGLSFELDYAFQGQGSVKAHWRRWRPSGASLEVAAGPMFGDVLIAGNGGDVRVRAKGATADVSVIGRHNLGVFVGTDYLNGAGRSSLGVHAGVRAEAKWALAATAAVGAVFLFSYWALGHGA